MKTSRAFRLVLSCAAVLSLAACGDDENTTGLGAERDTAGDDATSDATEETAPDATEETGEDTVADTAPDTLPDTEEPLVPLLPEYSGGECPTLELDGNSLETGDAERDFRLFLPEDPAGKPVYFFYYGTGDSADRYDDFQDVADAWDMVVVVPAARGNLTFEWPIMVAEDPADELVFFDDMIACIAAQFEVDTTRIYASGFSAGALWTTTLAMKRSQILAAAAIYSGGTGDLVQPFAAPLYPIPVLGYWGGDGDVFAGFVNFAEFMNAFMDQMVDAGNFVIGCNHDTGHTIPLGELENGIDFVLEHAWQQPSKYENGSLPSYLPDYCEIW